MKKLILSSSNIWFYFFSIIFGCSFILKGNLSKNFIDDLAFSNFVAYGSNLCILILMAAKLEKNLFVKNTIILRTGNKSFIYSQFFTSFIMLFLYLAFQYSLAFLLSTPSRVPLGWSVLFLETNTAIMLIVLFINHLMNYGLKKHWVIVISIAVVLIYHYIFVYVGTSH